MGRKYMLRDSKILLEMCIRDRDKAPGIYSARFAGEDTSYDIKNRFLLDRLE